MNENRYPIAGYIIAATYFTLYGLVKYLPSPVGDWLRYLMLKPFVKRLRSSRIKDGVTIWFPKGVSIGKHVSINENVFIDGYGQVEIGNCCRIAHQVSILSEDHGFNRRDKPIYQQKKIKGKVTLEEDVWVGCGARILKGVTIGKGAVIGANSVVTKDIPQYAVAVGVPARVVKYRGEGREDVLVQKP